MRRTSLIIRTFVLALAFPCACADEADAPLPPRWVRFSFYPEGCEIKGLAAAGNDVWAVVRDSDHQRNIILKYAGNNFIEEYSIRGMASWLTDIYFSNSFEGWAAGGYYRDGERVPLLLKYEHDTARWEPVVLPEQVKGVITAFTGETNGGRLWFLIDKNFDESSFNTQERKRKGILSYYHDGAVKEYGNFGEVTTGGARHGGLGDYFYAAQYKKEALSYGENFKVYVTSDGGASWATENISRNVVSGFTIKSGRGLSAERTTAFLGFDFSEVGYYGVLKRAGDPSAPTYTLFFLSNVGPFFRGIKDMALAENPVDLRPGIAADGVMVGDDTTVIVTGGNVLLEQLPYSMDIADVCAAPGSGFWAAGYNKATGIYELLYHP